MKDLFNNIIDIIVFYDRPVLFISEINNTKYICGLINDNGIHEEWLFSDITEQTYDSLKRLEIDLYTCFKNSKSGESQILQISESSIEYRKLLSVDILDENLPLRGIYERK